MILKSRPTLLPKGILLITTLLLSELLMAQIKSGPMLGYRAMKEVAVWIQTEDAMELNFEYAPKTDPSQIQKKSFQSNADRSFTLHMIADRLEVGTAYEYRVLSKEGKQLAEGEFSTLAAWKYRTDPPDFAFLIGSCHYTNEAALDRAGEPYGQGMEIFKAMQEKEAEAMLWLGDNIYLRPGDWDSKSGIAHRYTHFKSQKELQDFWKSHYHYAIWDDHDYGPNDADRSFINKDLTLEAFQQFWANPNYGFNGRNDCITGMFSYNDLDFFLLDNRSFRSPNDRKTGERVLLGEEQLQWLIDALINSKATFKIVAVGGQVLSPAAVYENYATYPEERKQLLDLITAEGIKNVIFLSGDRHKTELSSYESENGLLLYDFTSSPLSSKAYNSVDEGNTLRVEGTHFAKQNFGMLKMEGRLDSRKLILRTYDTKGDLVWEKVIEPQK